MSALPRVIDPLFHFETHFPERISKLYLNSEYPTPHRRTKKPKCRAGARYKTQPITFDEIKEVDEENIEPEIQKKDNLRGQFQAFSRSMDGLVPKTTQSQENNNNNNNNNNTATTPIKPCLKKPQQNVSPLALESHPRPRRERSASTTEASTQTIFASLDKANNSNGVDNTSVELADSADSHLT